MASRNDGLMHLKFSKYSAVALCLMFGATGLFFHRLGQHSLWSDELQTAEVAAHISQSEIWNPTDPNRTEQYSARGFLAPYYSAVKAWCAVFGPREAGLRSLSAFSALLAMVMILVLGPDYWGLGRKASAAAAALFASSPMMLWYAQESRYYAFLQPVSLALCWFYLRFWKTWRGGWLAAWSACAVFALMSHPFMIFVIAALSCHGMRRWRQSRFRGVGGVVAGHAFAAAGFLFLIEPLLIAHRRVVANEPYNKPTDELMPWKALSNFLCGVYDHPYVISALALVVGATVIIVLHARETIQAEARSNVAGSQQEVTDNADSALWLAAALGACALMIAVSCFRPIMVEGKKYVMIFFAPFCVCMGSALMSPMLPRVAPLIFLGIMALNAALTDLDYFAQPQKQNWRLAGEMVRQHARAGDAWLHQGVWRAFAGEYYGGGNSAPVVHVTWPPPGLNDPLPGGLQAAKRVWLVKTGAIADVYGGRLEAAGFRRVGAKKLPSGSHFLTELWLYERASP